MVAAGAIEPVAFRRTLPFSTARMMLRRTLLALLLGPLAFASCTNQKQDTSASANEALIRQYYNRFNKHQWVEMANMYSDSAQFKDPSLGPGIVTQTRKQIADKYAALANTFPDVHDEVVQVYSAGDKHVIVEFVSTGTAPDSSKFELPICTIFTIENDRIIKDFTYYDNFEDPKAQ